ncbi:MAG: hypothetical protein FWD23_15890 [Oscillospiraceae bacterium]|nr:hypothetical protein [Oscillospiraceae bacterium]
MSKSAIYCADCIHHQFQWCRNESLFFDSCMTDLVECGGWRTEDGRCMRFEKICDITGKIFEPGEIFEARECGSYRQKTSSRLHCEKIREYRRMRGD